MRDFHLPGRSVAHGLHGAAATSHQQATLTAIETLRTGGNAVDAAIAAVALLGVIEPQNVGIGGDTFALIWSARDRRLYGINGSGWAPAGLSTDWLLAQGINSIPADMVHSVTVPGALRTWETLLARCGTKSLGSMLEPAIEAADQGFVVAERIASDWAGAVRRLSRHDATRTQFLVEGAAPKTGARLRLPKLAQTLRTVAKNGADVFYDSDLTDRMVASLDAAGGRHARADFAEWRPQFVEPVSIDYRGVDVWQIPPNGQGIITSIMLNILKGFDHSRLEPVGPDRFHLQIEAYKLAAAARDAYIADPDHVAVPVAELLSERYAEALRARIDMKRAADDPVVEPIGPNDTIYLTTADAEGNMVSLISSLSAAFGSAIACGETGVLFQNRGSNFRVLPGHPNTVAPRKRSLHTIIPGFATRGGEPWLSFGVMHGFYQPVGQTQVFQNIVDFGLDVQEAIDMPRGLRTPQGFEAERGFPNATLAGLIARGHPVRMADMAWGGAQAILREDGAWHAGSEPRKDGCALAY
jgi:gamma-glutamyltranspeptidase/glutathione hydrolase